MTVSDLIKKLSEFPGNAEVRVTDPYDFPPGSHAIREVDLDYPEGCPEKAVAVIDITLPGGSLPAADRIMELELMMESHLRAVDRLTAERGRLATERAELLACCELALEELLRRVDRYDIAESLSYIQAVIAKAKGEA